MPWKRIPFDELIDFEGLKNKKVLEIGVGNGSHAQLLASHAGSYTGLDLTNHAVTTTSKRLALFNIPAEIRQMDADDHGIPGLELRLHLELGGDPPFLQHREEILKEMHRVPKPGADAIVIVYYRGFWNYYVCGGLIHGILLGDLFRTRFLAKTAKRQTDGALARFYTMGSFSKLVEECGFSVEYSIVKGSKAELFPIPGGKFKARLMTLVPNAVTRFFTNNLRMGSFLVCRFSKS